MREVAARAGVGERTLYDAFPNKEALFLEVVGVAIGGDDRPVPVAERPEFLAALDRTDPEAVVETFADYGAELLERAGPLIMVAVESAGADQAMRRFADAGAAATAANVAAVVAHLVRLGAVSDERLAIATITALVSPHVHQIVRGAGGLSSEEYRDWLRAALLNSLGPN